MLAERPTVQEIFPMEPNPAIRPTDKKEKHDSSQEELHVRDIKELPQDFRENNFIYNPGHAAILPLAKTHRVPERERMHILQDLGTPIPEGIDILVGENNRYHALPLSELALAAEQNPYVAGIILSMTRQEVGNAAMNLEGASANFRRLDQAVYRDNHEASAAFANVWQGKAQEARDFYLTLANNAAILRSSMDKCFNKHGVYEAEDIKSRESYGKVLEDLKKAMPGIDEAKIIEYFGLKALTDESSIRGAMDTLQSHIDRINNFYTKPSEQN